MQKAFEEAESKRDMTYDEFLQKYLDHIEGRVDADQRQANRPITADGGNTEENANKSALATITSQKDQQQTVEEVKADAVETQNQSN